MQTLRTSGRVELLLGAALLLLGLLAGLSPAAAPAAAPVIAAAGDIACPPNQEYYNGGEGTDFACAQARTADLISSSPNQRVLPLGDLIDPSPQLARFKSAYLPTWGRFKKMTRPTLGNHEYDYGVNTKGYFDFFNGVGDDWGRAGLRGEGWYSSRLNGWLLIALNANCGRRGVSCAYGSEQVRWLRRTLRENPAKCVLAYWHQPLFSSGAHGGEQPVEPFWSTLMEFGADVVLNGHDHLYERFAPQDAAGRLDRDGPAQFTVGTGGRSLFAFSNRVAPNSRKRIAGHFGILRMRLMGNSYRYRFVSTDEGVMDGGRGSCR